MSKLELLTIEKYLKRNLTLSDIEKLKQDVEKRSNRTISIISKDRSLQFSARDLETELCGNYPETQSAIPSFDEYKRRLESVKRKSQDADISFSSPIKIEKKGISYINKKMKLT